MEVFNPYGSDSDGFDESNEDYDIDDGETKLKRARQSLGHNESYVPHWKPSHAIREFYQNWKDAIVETTQLGHNQVSINVKGFDKKDVYVVEARHPSSNNLLGFIRFKDGALEFTNFNAQLRRSALDIGGTTKANNEDTAGEHGEGFKLAALVMLRREYKVRYEASSFYWNFKLEGRKEKEDEYFVFCREDKKRLYCYLSPMSELKLAKQRETYDAKVRKAEPRELINNIWEDVSVKIGKYGRGGKKIEKTDFLKWIAVSLDLSYPEKKIDTPHGALILDDAFKGKVYLKSLLLENSSTTKPFRYGYNFFHGGVDRERNRLADVNEEAKVLANIWAAAINSNEQETLDSYVDLLRNDEKADVNGTANYVSEATAKKIWEQLVEKGKEKKLFYHDVRNGDTDIDIIRNSLKLEPSQLSQSIWTPLKKYKLVRTPQEQQYHLLHSAPPADFKGSTFASGVRRALRASLALDERTKDLEIVFKQGGNIDIDLLLTGKVLEINDKWLDFDRSHSKVQCWLATRLPEGHSGSDQFSCDHIISDLYEQILEEVKRSPDHTHNATEESNKSLALRVRENLRQMPIIVETIQTDEPGELLVTWADLDHDKFSELYGIDTKFRVVLHCERACIARKEDLLFEDLPEDEFTLLYTDQCGCPLQSVSRKKASALFTGLDRKEKYFPMVSREEHQAFYGVSAKSVSPSGKSRKRTAIETRGRGSQKPKTPVSQYSSLSDLRFRRGSTQVSDLYDDPDPNRGSRSGAGWDDADQDWEDNAPGVDQDWEDDAPGDDPVMGGTPELEIIEPLPVKNSALSNVLNLSVDKLRTKISNQEAQLQDKDEQLSIMQQDIDNLETEISDLERQQAEAELQIQNLSNQLEEKEKGLTEATAKIEHLGSALRVQATEIERYQRAEEDASGVINDLRIKVGQLQDAKEDLERQLESAEENLDTQIRLTSETAQRRRVRNRGVKREVGDDEAHVTIKTEPSTKRQRTVITTSQEGIVDLTSDNEDPSA